MRNTPVLMERTGTGDRGPFQFIHVHVQHPISHSPPFTMCVISPVEVEDVVEDFRVPVEEELVALDDVVITQVQLPAVVCVRGQLAETCLRIPGS